METFLKKKEDSEEEMCVKVPVLLPHRILAFLFDELGLEISAATLSKYWAHCKRWCDWCCCDEYDGTHIPVSLYGDTARYGQGYDQAKVTGCFMSLVLWRPKSTRMSQWLLWSLDTELSLGWRSHNPLYLAIVESLNAAFDGLTPDNRPLGRKFAVTQIKGDWEYHFQTWRLKRWWKTRWCCWRCDAENHHQALHSICDLQDNPSWAQTELSHNEFVVHGIGQNHVCDFTNAVNDLSFVLLYRIRIRTLANLCDAVLKVPSWGFEGSTTE